ncbi:MAG: hypothetical protein VXW65_00455, partial [Pseudomonadota bacterium]|nr:hypothetical protein [Pseudomonadota bacterium]
MKNQYRSLIAIVALSSMVVAPLAEARRVGGGNSVGMSRNTAPAPQRQAQQQPPTQNNASSQQAAPQPARSGGVGIGTVAGAAVAAGAVGYMMGNSNEAQAAESEPMATSTDNPIASEPVVAEQPSNSMSWLWVV